MHTNPGQPGHRRSRAVGRRRGRRRGSAPRSSRRCRRRASRPAASTFPGTATRSVDSHEALPVVEHDRRRLDAVEFVPFRARDCRRRRDDHDGARAGAGDRRAIRSRRSRRASSTDMLKETLGLRRRRHQRRPRHEGRERDDAAAGGDGRRRSPPAATSCCCATRRTDEQVAAIEALIRAAESGDIPTDAHRRRAGAAAARSKERFLAPAPPRRRRSTWSDARRIRRSRGRWRRGSDAAHRGGSASSSGRCGRAAASRWWRRPAPFDRAEFDAGVAELRRLGLRAGLRRQRLRARGDCRPAGRASRAQALLRAFDETGRRRRHRRARRLRQRRDAAAARRRTRSGTSRTAFVGYSDVTSLHSFLDCHVGLASVHGADDRRPAGEGRRRRTIRASFLTSLSDRAARRARAGRPRGARAGRGARARWSAAR